MTVELRELKWAIMASQNRSLRQAADRLNVRQSTLSRRLRELERCLGAVLFERTNGGTRPTAAGQEFLEAARRIIEETEAAVSRLKARSCGESGRLTVGVYASLSAGNLRATLMEHHHRFPDVDLHVVDGTHDRLLCDLAASAIDVAIMTSCYRGWDDRMLPLWSERVIAAFPEHHRLADHDAIDWSLLANERILAPQHGPGPELEQVLLSKLHPFGQPRILRQDVGLDRLLSLVSTGFGVLLMLEGATGVHYDGVVYREVHESGEPTRFNFAAYWRQANSNPTLTQFLSMLRERYPDLSTVPPLG